MRAFLVSATVTVGTACTVAACAAPPAASSRVAGSSSAAPRPVSTDAASLLSRPMRLPSVSSGSTCPVTPVATISTGVTDPRGKGPLYFGGPMPLGGFPFNKMVYTTVGGVHGPILLRGGRIDGAGRLTFSGSPADLSEKAEIPPPPGGEAGSGSWAFYQAVLDPGPDNALYVYPSTPGCYAIQVNASSFEEVIILRAG